MRGYRVVPLTSEGKISNEVGEIHHFSISLQRSEWWAVRLPSEDVQYVPCAFDYAMNGYAIMEVQVEDIQPDLFSPTVDYQGRIVSAEIVKVVRHTKPHHRPWWKIISRRR